MNRLGFHYFPDDVHYRQQDLTTWLPRLQALGASWVTLRSRAARAIPEFFVRGMLEGGLQTVIHLPLSPEEAPSPPETAPLLEAYARWGVRYVMLFERPNQRSQWKSTDWAQVNLVERFLQRFLPLARQVQALGMQTVFPPLQPGGDYWDTAFLRAALTSLAEQQPALLEGLVIGALAHAGERPLDWGTGGPERWPGARPYYTPPSEQDHRGFAIFEWYSLIAQAACGHSLPLMLFESGSPGGLTTPEDGALAPETHRQRTLHLARRAAGMEEGEAPEIPGEVLACHFPAIGEMPHAWYTAAGKPTPLGEAWLKSSPPRSEPFVSPKSAPEKPSPPAETRRGKPSRPIRHYVLLPAEARHNGSWREEVIPALLHSGATIGFSLREAALAEQVTILGSERAFPETCLQKLRATGCRVVRLSGSGTELAYFWERLNRTAD